MLQKMSIKLAFVTLLAASAINGQGEKKLMQFR